MTEKRKIIVIEEGIYTMKKIARNTKYFSKARWQKDVIMFLNAGGNGPVPSFQSINIQYSATAHYSELFIRFALGGKYL